MKNQFSYLPILLFSLLLLSSCSSESDKSSKIASTGGANEMLIITQNTEQWNGEIGDSIRAAFAVDMPVLSIAEKEFNLVNVNEKSLEKQMFKTHHNLFILEIDKKFPNAFIEIHKDLWSEPQMVIKINAPSHDAFLQIFEENKFKALELYRENERKRIINSYASKFKNTNISRELKKNFNLDMNVPKGYNIAVLEGNFAWIRKETTTNSMSVMIYTVPYADTNAFNPNKIRQSRNLLTKVKIPGPTLGSYQKIADEFVPVQSRRINFNGQYATELRGLWDLENDFMGGPFLSYTFVDEKTNRVITIDGFLYAPKQKKAVMLRELEAILWSTKLSEN
ncbi:MAG: DUF4837 family protein [Bacteroidales bacterium]|nr:DUF4837 family protein [Bacteroidales bacterium]